SCASHRTVSEENLVLNQLECSARDTLRAIRLLRVPLSTAWVGVRSFGARGMILDGGR
ncbi:hypothetical protein QBC32DRAFT_213164, partial [Pseudoneurospora amorphoporcata]